MAEDIIFPKIETISNSYYNINTININNTINCFLANPQRTSWRNDFKFKRYVRKIRSRKFHAKYWIVRVIISNTVSFYLNWWCFVNDLLADDRKKDCREQKVRQLQKTKKNLGSVRLMGLVVLVFKGKSFFLSAEMPNKWQREREKEREREPARNQYAEYMAQYFRQRGETATSAETQKRAGIVKLLLLRKLSREREREREREPLQNCPA